MRAGAAVQLRRLAVEMESQDPRQRALLESALAAIERVAHDY